MNSRRDLCYWELRLIFEDGSIQSSGFLIPKGKITVGRAKENFIQCESLLSSRQHCAIHLYSDGNLFIEDLDSLNGTFLGCLRIPSFRLMALKLDDRIGIGVEPTKHTGAPCVYQVFCRMVDEVLHEVTNSEIYLVPAPNDLRRRVSSTSETNASVLLGLPGTSGMSVQKSLPAPETTEEPRQCPGVEVEASAADNALEEKENPKENNSNCNINKTLISLQSSKVEKSDVDVCSGPSDPSGSKSPILITLSDSDNEVDQEIYVNEVVSEKTFQTRIKSLPIKDGPQTSKYDTVLCPAKSVVHIDPPELVTIDTDSDEEHECNKSKNMQVSVENNKSTIVNTTVQSSTTENAEPRSCLNIERSSETRINLMPNDNKNKTIVSEEKNSIQSSTIMIDVDSNFSKNERQYDTKITSPSIKDSNTKPKNSAIESSIITLAPTVRLDNVSNCSENERQSYTKITSPSIKYVNKKPENTAIESSIITLAPTVRLDKVSNCGENERPSDTKITSPPTKYVNKKPENTSMESSIIILAPTVNVSNCSENERLSGTKITSPPIKDANKTPENTAVESSTIILPSALESIKNDDLEESSETKPAEEAVSEKPQKNINLSEVEIQSDIEDHSIPNAAITSCDEIIVKRCKKYSNMELKYLESNPNTLLEIPAFREIKKELSSYTVVSDNEEGVIVIDDDDDDEEVELPLSQMFDVEQLDQADETDKWDEDCRKDGDGSNDEEDINSDVSSTDEGWFQRLSQCNDLDFVDCEDMSDQTTQFIDAEDFEINSEYSSSKRKSLESQDLIDERSNKNEKQLSHANEIPYEDDYPLSKDKEEADISYCKDDNVKERSPIKHDDNEETSSGNEPLFRKAPSGSKRELQDTSDEDSYDTYKNNNKARERKSKSDLIKLTSKKTINSPMDEVIKHKGKKKKHNSSKCDNKSSLVSSRKIKDIKDKLETKLTESSLGGEDINSNSLSKFLPEKSKVINKITGIPQQIENLATGKKIKRKISIDTDESCSSSSSSSKTKKKFKKHDSKIEKSESHSSFNVISKPIAPPKNKCKAAQIRSMSQNSGSSTVGKLDDSSSRDQMIEIVLAEINESDSDRGNLSGDDLSTNQYIGDFEEQIIPSKIVKSQSNNTFLIKNNEACSMNIETPINKGKGVNQRITSLKDVNLLKDDPKLIDVNKKILASHQKKSIPIIDALSLSSRKKQVTSDKETNGNQELNKNNTSTEKWLSKNQTEKLTSHKKMSKSELKAYRSAKLKDLSMPKQAIEKNKSEEKTKQITTAKNTTKITNRNRGEIFLDTLVEEKPLKVNDKLKEKIDNDRMKTNQTKESKPSLATFKIPRRASTNDETNPSYETTKSLGSTSSPVSATEKSSNNVLKPSNSSKRHLTTTSKVTNVTDCLSLVDKKLTEQISSISLSQLKKRVAHVPSNNSDFEDNDSVIVKLIPEKTKISLPHDLSIKCTKKSNLKGPISQKAKEKKKTVKFNNADDEPQAVYVQVKTYVLDSEGPMKKLTKNVKREGIPEPKNNTEELAPCIDYSLETFHQICKWNCAWFEEKNVCHNKEPPVFSGQVFPLQDEYSNYQDYRMRMFPVLLFELWQSFSQSFDDMKAKQTTKILGFEIRRIDSIPVINKSIPLNKANEVRLLFKLECHLLQDGHQAALKAGDVVALDCHLKYKQKDKVKSKKERLLACVYVVSPIQSFKARIEISHELKNQNPRAKQMLIFSMYIRDKRPFYLEEGALGKLFVIKNMKSELRQFEALDYLSSSHLCKSICQPKENIETLPNHDFSKLFFLPIFDKELNDSQKKAITSVAASIQMKSNMIHLIHGPPGCGKSEVIICIIMQLWYSYYKTKKRTGPHPQILLCAPSNAAVDDIFLRLVKIREKLKVPKFNMARIGIEDSMHMKVQPWSLDRQVRDKFQQDNRVLYNHEERDLEIRSLVAKENMIQTQIESLNLKTHNLQRASPEDIEFHKKLQEKLAESNKLKKKYQNNDQKIVQEFIKKESRKDAESQFLSGAGIVAATLASCYNSSMADVFNQGKLHFDCCIVDEATQSTEPETLIPLLLKINNLVLVGDPHQLPPTIKSQVAKEMGFSRSLFGRIYDSCKRLGKMPPFYHLLNTQYRMHPAIIHWPAEYFYSKRVVTHSSVWDRTQDCPLKPYLVLSHEFEQSSQEESNQEEVKIVVELVKTMRKNVVGKDMTIGIITPYNKQKDSIKNGIEREQVNGVEVGTVDSYQGREKDIILFSCTRTEGIGFMANCERLNVALTRARCSLIIIGNFKSLQNDQTWSSCLNNAKERGLLKQISTTFRNEDLLSLVTKTGFDPNTR